MIEEAAFVNSKAESVNDDIEAVAVDVTFGFSTVV